MSNRSPSKLVTTIRFTESQRTDFEDAARTEGFDSVIQWMLKLAEKRVVVLNDAIASGRYVTIGDAKVPLSDIDADDLARAAEILGSRQSHQNNPKKK